MKHLQYAALALMPACVLSCSNCDEGAAFTWQKDLTYMATMNQFPPDTGDYLWADSSFMNVIWDKVMNGELEATDTRSGEVMDSTALKMSLIQIDSLFTINPATMRDTVIVVHTTFRKTDITDVAFRERIGYDATSNTLEKEVLAVGPVRTIWNHNTGRIVAKAVMFWVNVAGEEDD